MPLSGGSHCYFHHNHQETESNSAQGTAAKAPSIVINAQEQNSSEFSFIIETAYYLQKYQSAPRTCHVIYRKGLINSSSFM